MNPGHLVVPFCGIVACFAASASCLLKSGEEVLEHGHGKVFFVGSPIVDLYARVDNSVVDDLKNEKGTSQAVSHETFAKLGDRVAVETSNAGGSSANTSRAFAFLGGDASYCGVVGNDEDAKEFKGRLEEYGVKTDLVLTREDKRTNRAYCLVTPDGERTMYFLTGAAATLCVDDVAVEVLDDFDCLSVNAFSFRSDLRVPLLNKLADHALATGKSVVLLLANLFPVKTKKDLLRPFADKVSYLFGNVEEFKLLFDLPVDGELFQFLEARTAGENPVNKVVVVTAGSAGAHVFYHGGRFFVEPAAVGPAVVDTTGAGDFFAGAFLYGVLNGFSVKTSAEFARLLVGDLVTKVGTLLSADVRAKVDALKASVGRA